MYINIYVYIYIYIYIYIYKQINTCSIKYIALKPIWWELIN